MDELRLHEPLTCVSLSSFSISTALLHFDISMVVLLTEKYGDLGLVHGMTGRCHHDQKFPSEPVLVV